MTTSEQPRGSLVKKRGSQFCLHLNTRYPKVACNCLKELVGARGFEPPTPWSRTRCSTRLSHAPMTNPDSVARDSCGWRRCARGWRVVPFEPLVSWPFRPQIQKNKGGGRIVKIERN